MHLDIFLSSFISQPLFLWIAVEGFMHDTVNPSFRHPVKHSDKACHIHKCQTFLKLCCIFFLQNSSRNVFQWKFAQKFAHSCCSSETDAWYDCSDADDRQMLLHPHPLPFNTAPHYHVHESQICICYEQNVNVCVWKCKLTFSTKNDNNVLRCLWLTLTLFESFWFPGLFRWF